MALSINQIPIPVPSSTDPANFSARGDAVFGAFPNFITQTNALASEAAANRDLTESSKVAAANSETKAATYASNATTSANNASSSSVASLWVSGTTYAINDKRVSPITGQVYRRKTVGAGTTDPSLDSTNWYAILLDADTQYPNFKPTLNLDFANSGKLDPRITFTRASTATYFDKLGVLRTAANNEPRFDYDPVTLEAKGLLIEEQRTNLLTYSEQFDNAAWTKTNCTISANAIVSPDGAVGAEKLIEASGSSAKYINQPATLAATTSYTQTVYAKAAGRGVLQITSSTNLSGSGTTYQNFDLINGTLGSSNGGKPATITPVGNGWYRCSYADTSLSAASSQFVMVIVDSATATRLQAYTGDGTSGIYIWGAQLEAGAFPTSYIPTTTAQVTRAADSAVMTGANFSSWYRQDEGTAIVEGFIPPQVDGDAANYYLALSDGTNSNSIHIADVNGTRSQILTSGVSQFDQTLGAEPASTVKAAVAYKTNDSILSASGVVSPSADTSVVLPVVDRLTIGNRGDNSSGTTANGTIKKLTYYPKRLPDYQLQILTK